MSKSYRKQFSLKNLTKNKQQKKAVTSKFSFLLFDVFYNPFLLRDDNWQGSQHHRKEEEEGFITICLSGWVTSPPPACLTNSAGERKVPWHTHIILTSSPFPYLYRMPSTLLPLGPSPFVKTQGISSIAFIPTSFTLFSAYSGFFDGESISAVELLHRFSLAFVLEEPTASWLLRSCKDWLLAELLASPQVLNPVGIGKPIRK